MSNSFNPFNPLNQRIDGTIDERIVDGSRLATIHSSPSLQTINSRNTSSRRINSRNISSRKINLRDPLSRTDVTGKNMSILVKPVTTKNDTPPKITDKYKALIAYLYNEKIRKYVNDYITIRVNYKFGFYKRRVGQEERQREGINILIDSKITQLNSFFSDLFRLIIYRLHLKKNLSLPKSEKRIISLWNVIMKNIYYIFNPIEKMGVTDRDNMLYTVLDRVENIFLYRVNLWANLYYFLRQSVPWQPLTEITGGLVERIEHELNSNMDYVYVYLITIPSSLFLSIFNLKYGIRRDGTYDPITMDQLQGYISRLPYYKSSYGRYIERISELPRDVTLNTIMEASHDYFNMFNELSKIEPREPLELQYIQEQRMTIPYSVYSSFTERDFKENDSRPGYRLYSTSEFTKNNGDETVIPEEWDRAIAQETIDNERIQQQLIDNPHQYLEEVTRPRTTGQLGGAMPSETQVINLIKNMRKIIVTPCGPEGGPIGEMEVKSILSDDPIWIEEEVFQGKKIVMDWIGIVMAYIVFKANMIVDDSGQPIDGEFMSSVVFENADDYRIVTGAEILTMEQCKNEGGHDKGFCTENATFSAFMPLIMLSLTLNHKERFLNKKARESYVVLRTTRKNFTSGELSKVVSVYNNKNEAINGHNILPERFAETISYIYAANATDPEFRSCIDTFIGLRQRMISLLTENNASILSSVSLPITVGAQGNIRYIDPDYRMILYNPSKETTEYKDIYRTYNRIVEYTINPEGSIITQGDFEILYKTVMFQPSLRSASNNKMPTDNWNGAYKSVVIQAYDDYINSRPQTMIGSRNGDAVPASITTGDVDDITMGTYVNNFNNEHYAIITGLLGVIPPDERYQIRFSDDTISFGFERIAPIENLPENLRTFLTTYAVGVKYNEAFTNISQPANGPQTGQPNYRKFCSFQCRPLVQDYLYLKLPIDMCHDACNKDRTSVAVATEIAKVANRAFRQIYPNGNVTYESLRSKGNIGGSSYEKECAKFGFMDEKQYANAVNNSPDEQITSGNVGLTVDESTQLSLNGEAFNHSNAVWTTKENTGNAATFVDGGTKKKLEYLNFPNVCVCMNEYDGEVVVRQFFIIVSYRIRGEGVTRELSMNVSLYYIFINIGDPTQTKHIFVNHEFILGKGISCHDIYNDIFRISNENRRPPEPNADVNLVDPALPVLLYLKKTLCDWLQNFLKIQYHTIPHPRLGFFVKMRDTETLTNIRAGIEPTQYPLLFSDYNRPIIVNSVPEQGGQQATTQEIDGIRYPIYNVFNSINIYWNHYRPTYSPKNFRYFNVSCNPRIAGSSICFTNDILDFCFSVSLSFLILVPQAQPNNPCHLPYVTANLTPAIGVMAGGSSHNNHKRKRQISYSNTKRRVKKDTKKGSKKNTKRRVSKRRVKQNKMKSKLTKKYRNKY
ncbi:MAG: hypothetical protein WCL51_11370 [Bacteroidota bacterium]